MFEELGLTVADRLSSEAVVECARRRARRFCAEGGSPRTLTAELYGMYIAGGCPDELADWSALDDWCDMVSTGVIGGTTDDVDAAVTDAARALLEGRESVGIALGQRFSDRPRRRWLSRLLRRDG